MPIVGLALIEAGELSWELRLSVVSNLLVSVAVSKGAVAPGSV